MMNQPDGDQLWVGAFKATGALIVFDPQLQVGDAGRVQLYSLNTLQVRNFERREVRTMLTAASEDQRSKALLQYATWKESSLNAYMSRARAEASKLPIAPGPTASGPGYAVPAHEVSLHLDSASQAGIPRWRINRPPPRKSRGTPSGNVTLGSQAALVLLGAVNPFLGIGAFIGGLLWAKSLKKGEAARDKETVQRWRAERMEIYEEYLQSHTWQHKREAVIRRAHGVCEHPSCSAYVREVHHERYPNRLGDEPIDWLVGLCERHHDERHQGNASIDE